MVSDLFKERIHHKKMDMVNRSFKKIIAVNSFFRAIFGGTRKNDNTPSRKTTCPLKKGPSSQANVFVQPSICRDTPMMVGKIVSYWVSVTFQELTVKLREGMLVFRG